jgi:hypothetical protein
VDRPVGTRRALDGGDDRLLAIVTVVGRLVVALASGLDGAWVVRR